MFFTENYGRMGCVILELSEIRCFANYVHLVTLYVQWILAGILQGISKFKNNYYKKHYPEIQRQIGTIV